MNSLIGKPKNGVDGQYKGVKPYKSLEIIKKEDFIPKAPVRITSKKQIAEEISSMVEAIMPSQNSAENHNER